MRTVRPFAPLYLSLALCLGVLGYACATANVRHNATLASGTVYDALGAIQDTEATLYGGGQLTAAQDAAFRAQLVTALQAGRAFNAAVQAWPHQTPVPPTLQQTVTNLFTAANAAVAALPLGPAKDAIVTQVLAVSQTIATILLSH